MRSLITLLAACLTFFSNAQVPNLIPYQGQISDTSGTFYNGTYDFQFAINDGSTELWSSGTISLDVYHGAYSVVLGESPQPALPANLWNNNSLFLQISFDDGVNSMETLSPDVSILPVPYAIRASYADSSGAQTGFQNGDSLVLRDQNGDVRFVLNPNTGTFRMMQDDTAWYQMQVASPPIERYEYNGNIVEKYANGNSTIKETRNKSTGKLVEQETHTSNPDGSSQLVTRRYDQNGDLVSVKILKLDANKKLCIENMLYEDGKLIEESNKKGWLEEKKRYNDGVLVMHYKDTAHFRIIEHYDSTTGKKTYTEKRTVGAYAESYDFEIRDSTGKVIGWRNENMRNNSSTYRDVATGRFIVVEPGTMRLESPNAKLRQTADSTVREKGKIKVTSKVSNDGTAFEQEVTDTNSGKKVTLRAEPDFNAFAVDDQGKIVRIAYHSMEMDALDMGMKIDMDLGKKEGRISVYDSFGTPLPLILDDVRMGQLELPILFTDSIYVPVLRFVDPADLNSRLIWDYGNHVYTGTHSSGAYTGLDFGNTDRIIRTYSWSLDTIVLTEVPKDHLRETEGVEKEVAKVDETGHEQVYEYDNNTNVVRIREINDPETETRTYDGLDRIIHEVDSPGIVTEYKFDTDKMSNTSNPKTGTVEYDGYDRVVSRVDDAGQEQVWEYDPTGHFVKETINTKDSTKSIEGLNKVEHTNEWIRHVVKWESGRTVGVDYDQQTNDSISKTTSPAQKSESRTGVQSMNFNVDSFLQLLFIPPNTNDRMFMIFDPLNHAEMHGGMEIVRMEFPGSDLDIVNPFQSITGFIVSNPSSGDSIGMFIQPELRQLQLVSPQGPTTIIADTILPQGFFGVNGQAVINGNLDVIGNVSKLGGSFKIDHPLDPDNKFLVHSFVESPDMMNIYNGNITTNADGEAQITLPPYFEALNMDFRYQLTVVGQFAQAVVWEEIEGNQFSIRTDKPNVKVSWQVTGIRHDPYADENRIEVEVEKDEKQKGVRLYQPQKP